MAATLYNPPVREEMIRLEGKPTGSTKVRGLEHILFVCRQRLQGVPRTLAEVNYSLQILSVLRALGWQKSIRSGEPVDVQGMEIPWYSYAALEWLTPRVKPTDVVFEYGAGNSTAWFARHAKRVVSVEHNPTWLTRVHAKVGENVTLLSRHTSQGEESGDAGSSYVAALEEFAPESFDIIAIDGPERVSCARVAPTRLRSDGIIILDDSDRPAFERGIAYLHYQGFSRVDFYGFVSQVGIRKCTSVFFKPGTRWTEEKVPLVCQGW